MAMLFLLMLPAFCALLLMALSSGRNADDELIRLLAQDGIRPKQ